LTAVVVGAAWSCVFAPGSRGWSAGGPAAVSALRFALCGLQFDLACPKDIRG